MYLLSNNSIFQTGHGPVEVSMGCVSSRGILDEGQLEACLVSTGSMDTRQRSSIRRTAAHEVVPFESNSVTGIQGVMTINRRSL